MNGIEYEEQFIVVCACGIHYDKTNDRWIFFFLILFLFCVMQISFRLDCENESVWVRMGAIAFERLRHYT